MIHVFTDEQCVNLYVQKWDIIYQMDCALIGKKGKDLKNILNF